MGDGERSFCPGALGCRWASGAYNREWGVGKEGGKSPPRSSPASRVSPSLQPRFAGLPLPPLRGGQPPPQRPPEVKQAAPFVEAPCRTKARAEAAWAAPCRTKAPVEAAWAAPLRPSTDPRLGKTRCSVRMKNPGAAALHRRLRRRVDS
jgi:hypothetical protein